MNNKKRFNNILQDIETVKIQGAKNVARAALKAYSLIPSKESKQKLLSVRPTEPLLFNVFKKLGKKSEDKIIDHFENTQKKINKHAFKIIRNRDVIFTHCHSNTVIESLIYAKNMGKNFEVYNTETRPLYQGRKTANELRKAGIKVTIFVDSAFGVALSEEQGTKKADKVFLGADALLNKGIINKIGSESISRIARLEKIPVYILADSWKFSKKKPKLEQRSWREIWKSSRKSINLKIQNPAFEFVPKKYISGIITEFGLMRYKRFLKKIKSQSKK